MVAVSNSKRRHILCSPRIAAVLTFGGTVKPQTIFTVTIGLAMLMLFSAEPVIRYESPILSSLRASSQHSTDNSAVFRPLPPPRPFRPAASRYGMVPQQAVRTPIMQPMDIMMDDYAIKNSIVDDPSPIYEIKRSSPSHPRVVFLVDTARELITWSQPRTDSTAPMPIGPPEVESIKINSMDIISTTHEEYKYTEIEILPFERQFVEECETQRNPRVHPTCNQLHELPLDDESISLFNTKGSWRTAWTVNNDTAVLKVLQWSRFFDAESYHHHAMDVIVSDLLTASPYVIDAYGFCGQSILQEWAPGSGRDFVKSYDIRNRQRLRIARDMARGLADLQTLEAIPHESFKDNTQHRLISRNIPQSPPLVFAHNDINIANTINVNGKVKWNDFNIGVLLRTRIGSNFTEDCGAPVKFRADLWRSPEEVRNSSYVQLQYTDMYGFGNILYQVMTRHQPWTHKEPEGILTTEQVAERKRQGRLPTIPEQYRNTTNRDLQTMVLATMSCYHPIPSKRLTAYELAHALSYVYDRLQKKQKVPTSMLRELFFKKSK